MTAALLVRQPGLLTTVQDLGRPGLGRFGVPVSGAMDPLALRVANRLVGNGDGAPTLEVTAIGPELELAGELRFALAGADLAATLDGEPLELWRAHRGRAGQVLAFGQRRRGARCYLAVAGGIGVRSVMGSAATDLESGLGGCGGGALRPGQRLAVGKPPADGAREMSPRLLAAWSDPFTLRFIPAAAPAPPPAALAAFASAPYRVGSRSNRMGYRLEGAQLELGPRAEMLSEPVPPGCIQVPHGAQPLLLMADRPTVGGYPQLGHVVAADLPKAGQLWLGHRVRFRATTLAEARRAIAEQEALLEGSFHR